MREAPDLGRLIAYCSHLGMLYIDKLLRQSGCDVTPAQSRTLIYLSCQRDRGVNQRDLEKELRLKPSTINGIVSRLEEKGFVVRRTSPSDARCRLVSLTEAGQTQAEAFEAILDGVGQRYAMCYTGEERETMVKLLARMIENLENEVNSV